MSRATLGYPTPELRETRYVRARHPVAVTLHQPLPRKRSRVIAGRLLGEVHVSGGLHHYRVSTGDGVVYLAPPEWLAPWCRFAVAAAGLTILDKQADGMFADRLNDLAEYYRARRRMLERTLDAEPEGAA